jgi:HNH endonuclease
LSHAGATVDSVATQRKFTNEELVTAVARSTSIRRVLAALGLAQSGGNYESVRTRIKALGLDTSHFTVRARSTISATEAEIRDAVARSRSSAQALTKLGQKLGSRNHAALTERAIHFGIDTSHFAGQGWRRGSRSPVVQPTPLNDVLVDGRLTNSTKLRYRLIAEGLKTAHCEMCNGSRWNGSPIPLELDHVNGNREDNRLANLRLVCPNCHAQTGTYRGRNIGAPNRYSLEARVPER